MNILKILLSVLVLLVAVACVRWPVVEWRPTYTSVDSGIEYVVDQKEIHAKKCYSSKGAVEAELRRVAKRKGFDDAAYVDCTGGLAAGCFFQWRCTGYGVRRKT